MRCVRNRSLLTRYALGEVDESLSREIERHLEQCPACRAEFAYVKEAVSVLRDALVTPDAFPEALGPERKKAIWRSVESDEGTSPSAIRWIFDSHPVLARAAAVVVLAALAAGAVIFSFPSRRRTAAPSAKEIADGVSLLTPEPGSQDAEQSKSEDSFAVPSAVSSLPVRPDVTKGVKGLGEEESENIEKQAVSLGVNKSDGVAVPPESPALAQDMTVGESAFDRELLRNESAQDALTHDEQEGRVAAPAEIGGIAEAERASYAGRREKDMAALGFRADGEGKVGRKEALERDAVTLNVLATVRREEPESKLARMGTGPQKSRRSEAVEWQKRVYRIRAEHLRVSATDAETIRRYLEKRGVSWPDGSAMALDADAKILVVSNTVVNLDRLEEIAADLARRLVMGGGSGVVVEKPAASEAAETGGSN